MDDARLVEKLLKEQGSDTYELLHTVSIAEATDLLANKARIDVILSDIALPDSHGAETFSKLKKAASNLPVVFFTESRNERLALAALQKGAQDYLVKGHFDGTALIRAIRYAIERKKFENDAKTARTKARSLRQKAELLKQQKAQLLALNEAKDDFISMASHQLRTPATGVKQYIGMLLQGFAGNMSTDQTMLAQNAYDSNERQLNTIDNLLIVAQLDAGQLSLYEEQSDIIALLQSVLDEQQATFEERSQPVAFHHKTKHTTVTVDEKLMRMVFENLIDNASKYTPGGKKLSVSVENKRSKVVISIADQGVGIAPSDINKLFAKFSRIHNPLSQAVSGSGLGLYWVKKVVDLHGGTIEVISTLGQGTAFKVILPKQGGE